MTHPHVTEREVVDFEGRRLSPPDLLRVTDHLVSCSDCRRRLAHGEPAGAAGVLRTALFTPSAPEAAAHVSDEELADYVDGRLSPIDVEIVATHLEDCSACAAEARDLQSFRAAGKPAAATADRRSGKPGLWQTLLVGVGVAAAAVVGWFALPLVRPTDAPRGQMPAARVAVFMDASFAVTKDAQGRWTGWPPGSSTLDAQIRRILDAKKLDVPAEALALPGRRASLRSGAPDAPASFLLGPVGVVVEEDRPEFRWQPVARANRYVVIVSPADGGTLVKSPALTATEWTPARPLERGRSYLWQVTASTPSVDVTAPRPPEPEARFRVLDSHALQALEEARRAPARSHLVLGILYAEAGLLDGAERELTALAAINPGAALPGMLLADLRARRPQKAAPTTENPAQ